MKIVKTTDREFEAFLFKLINRKSDSNVKIETTVRKIIADVVSQGDDAVFKYAKKFDGHVMDAATVEVSSDEWKEAISRVKKDERDILKLAAGRIRDFHSKQITEGYQIDNKDGITVGQRITPLERIGIYAPGGLAAYPSTVLMAAIPAKIAGVQEIILTSPTKGRGVNSLIAAAAELSGVTRIFKVGGAQAIAAMAYGTRSIPRVDKIVGPGNIYVAEAKKMIFGQADIDMIAGPSEVLIIADDTAEASFAAADMIAQAEHDAMASAVLLTPDTNIARKVQTELTKQLKILPKQGIARSALESFGAVIVTRNIGEAIDIANRFAPEHLELMVKNPRRLLSRIKNAGAVFLGHYTPEALGDYVAGPNHILPTNGTARFSSPLGVYDFIKRMSVLSFSGKALNRYGRQTASFAELEGLDGHSKSIKVRMAGKHK